MYEETHMPLLEQIDGGIDGIAGGDAMDGVDESPDIVDTTPVMPLTNQLTLSFHGEVYVFDSVPAEKVQAVLLLLGGQELPPDFTSAAVPFHQFQNHEGMYDIPRCSAPDHPHRAASLARFREKRKDRCFQKKIRYTVRKEVALRMQRKKGQFTSSKTISEEVASGSSDWNYGQGVFQEEILQENFCQHCGISEKSTPMMRRGPAGPKSLCNACGLMWANKGTLKDITKASSAGTQNPSVNANEQSDANDSDVGSSCQTAAVTSNGHHSAVTTET